MHISHNRGLSRGFLRGSCPGQPGRGEESSSRFPSSMDYTTTACVLREAKRPKNNLGRGFRLAQESQTALSRYVFDNDLPVIDLVLHHHFNQVPDSPPLIPRIQHLAGPLLDRHCLREPFELIS